MQKVWYDIKNDEKESIKMKKVLILLLSVFILFSCKEKKSELIENKGIGELIEFPSNVYASLEEAFSDFETKFSKTLLMIKDSSDKEKLTKIYNSMINLSKLTGEKDERKSQIIFKNGDESLTITNTVESLKSALGNTVKTSVIYNKGDNITSFYLPYNLYKPIDYDLLILIPNGGKKENVKQKIEEDFAPCRAIEANTIGNKISVSDFYWY